MAEQQELQQKINEEQAAVPGYFRPNIYPVMYWGLAYGVSAGVLLFLVFLLSQYITLVWFPIFLVGLIWGGYRNYKKQKTNWQKNTGSKPTATNAVGEFKEAISDIVDASRDLIAEEPAATVQPEPKEEQEPQPPTNVAPPAPPQ